MDYGFEHDGKVYTPNGTTGITPEENQARNDAISAAEIAEWGMRPRYQLGYFKFPADRGHSFEKTPRFPYRCNICHTEQHLSPELCDRSRQYRHDYYPALHGAIVTAWGGQTIGRIISAHIYTHNFGGRFVSLTVQGTNGARYHGRASWDNGECINLRRSK